VVEVGGCWLLILELFVYEEQTTYCLRTSKRSLYEGTLDEKMDRAPEIEKKGAGKTWQLTETLCDVLHHWK
jgi:hypothetical protein